MGQKLRKDISPRWRWDLSHMFKNKQALEDCAKQMDAGIPELAALAGKVHEDPMKAVRASFALSRLAGNYFVYSRMQQDQDGSNSAYKAQMARAEAYAVKVRAAGAFLEPELLMLPESTLKRLMEDEELSEYSVFFHKLLRQKPHILPPEQEQILAKGGEVFATASRTFNILDNVDLPLPETLMEDGSKQRLTHADYGNRMRSHNRAVRRDAFTGMMNAYGDFKGTLSTLYISSVKNDVLQADLRHYASAREASLSQNDIPLSVYDSLLKEAHKAFPILDRYMRLRKKALGLDELHLYDLYVPITDSFQLDLPYQKAAKMVKDGLKPLGSEYQGLLERAFSERWIDVYETRGKRSGAYSWGTYDSHPYVLLNHTDSINGAMTLAHELGHAMHSYYSNQTQPYEKAQYSLFAAEVASTCNEVLFNHALQEEYRDNKQAQLFFLTDLAEGFRTTFFRQTMFAEFEHLAHQMAEKGEALTDLNLSNLYEQLNRQYYGRECVINPEIRHEWMRIPHFYRAFYVYQYATGYSAAVYLASRILKDGQKATDRYFDFLKSGGSTTPIKALQAAGADMTKPQVVRGAMKVFEETVARMEALMD